MRQAGARLILVIKMAELEKFTTYLNQWLDLNENLGTTCDAITRSCIKCDLNHYAEEGHYFKINNDVLGLFLSTKPLVCYKALRLPFSSIYLDITIPVQEKIINGILLNQSSICDIDNKYLKENFEDLYETSEWENLSHDDKNAFRESMIQGGIISITFQIKKENGNIRYDTLGLSYSQKGDLVIETESQILNKYEELNLISIIKNFCLFCNDPRVSLISRKMTMKDIFKRRKRNQPIAPNLVVTHISEEMRRYIVESRPFFYQILKNIKDFFHNKKRYKLTYSYWVKGHYRKLRSEKFVNKKGEVIWIAPYKKGNGVFVKQEFVLKPKKRIRIINEEKLKGD